MDEIVWCYHSSETSSAVILHGTICLSAFYKMKFRKFDKSLNSATFESEKVKHWGVVE